MSPDFESNPLALEAIGWVHNAEHDAGRQDWRGTRSRIELRPDFEAALLGLGDYSHVIVVGWLHEISTELRGRLQAFPSGDQRLPLQGALALRALWKKNGKAGNDYVARMAKEKPDRIFPLAFCDSIAPEAPKELERAVAQGCKGLKLFNIGHFPWDERCFPLYEKADELHIPILFHSGILGDARNSRFHRPAEYEIVKNWPTLKVLLAHISWPWTDECIATAGMCSMFEKIRQIHVDLTPGAPLQWREEATKKAIDYLPDYQLIFGTDGSSVGTYQAQVLREQDYIFEKLNVPQELQKKIYWQNAVEFWSIKE